MSERINGILKDGFYLYQTLSSVAHAIRASKNTFNINF